MADKEQHEQEEAQMTIFGFTTEEFLSNNEKFMDIKLKMATRTLVKEIVETEMNVPKTDQKVTEATDAVYQLIKSNINFSEIQEKLAEILKAHFEVPAHVQVLKFVPPKPDETEEDMKKLEQAICECVEKYKENQCLMTALETELEMHRQLDLIIEEENKLLSKVEIATDDDIPVKDLAENVHDI